jgi:hypothetical protein
MRLLPAAWALALSACATSATPALLRVDPPPPAPGAVADASEQRIARAVHDAVAADRFQCRPGAGAPDLLTCSPVDVGSRSVQATVHLERAASGYRVRIEEGALPGFHGDPAAVCALQRRIARAIDAELGVPSARPDPRGRCPEQQD